MPLFFPKPFLPHFKGHSPYLKPLRSSTFPWSSSHFFFSSIRPWYAFFPSFFHFLVVVWWLACGVFLAVGCSLGCLDFFSFGLKHFWYVFHGLCLVVACMHVFMFCFGHAYLDLLSKPYLISKRSEFCCILFLTSVGLHACITCLRSMPISYCKCL